MFRLLIAEDELWLRKRLVSTIDWEKHGVSSVQEAEDGEEALRLALDEEPDILITDIRMPELSGIDLMKALNESSVYPKTIVVSGYDDFEYAQEALRMGAVNYLLKPVEEEELLKTVEKCVRELEKEQKNKLLFDKQFAISELLIKHIYEDFLFKNNEYNKEDFQLLESLYGGDFSFPAKFACVINVELLNTEHFENKDLETDIWIIYHYLENIFREKLQNLFKKSYSYVRDSQIVLLVFSDDLYDIFEENLSDLKKLFTYSLKSNIGYPLKFSAGKIVENFAELHISYESALFQIKSDKKQDNLPYSAESADVSFEDVYADYNYKSIIREIKNGNSDKAEEELHLMLQTSSKRLMNTGIVRKQLFYINFINKLAGSCLPECEICADKLALQCINEIKEIVCSGTGTVSVQIKNSLEYFVRKLTEIYAKNKGIKRHWLMDQVLQYVEENYNTALSTRDIARRFFMNASYFSKLFHEQMGCTFSCYLISVRIEKAKIMLTQTNMKLYDIAYAVGYSNVQYFSTIFKEKEGTTPSKYRQLRTASNDEKTEVK